MDRESSKSRDQALSNQKDNRNFRPINKLEDVKEIKHIPFTDKSSANHHNNHQITSFQENFWSWLRDSYWSYFNQGIFWGGIIGLISILSASCGVALTKIDIVEKKINQVIDDNFLTVQADSSHKLVHPVNILLLEVKPSDDEIIQFSQAFTGENKTILLLQFEPQLKTVKVINIPVDRFVNIPGFGWGTIGDANKYGGTPLVSKAVAQLFNDVTIDRYIRATPPTFQKLIASGKIALSPCDARIKDCSDYPEKISRQQTTAETIRQRLNIPSYLKSFEQTLTRTQSDLDTNLSLPEVMSVINFVKEVEADNIVVNLASGYATSQDIDSPQYDPDFSGVFPTSIKSQSSNYNNGSIKSDRLTKNRPIAVQNTTDSPELGMRFVNYLRGKNFQDVFLVEHIPLKLDSTKIITTKSQLARAKYLKNIIGFGRLEPKSYSQQKPLTIQIGEDARHLPLNNPAD